MSTAADRGRHREAAFGAPRRHAAVLPVRGEDGAHQHVGKLPLCVTVDHAGHEPRNRASFSIDCARAGGWKTLRVVVGLSDAWASCRHAIRLVTPNMVIPMPGLIGQQVGVDHLRCRLRVPPRCRLPLRLDGS